MVDITEQDVAGAVNDILRRARDETRALSKEELERKWYYRHDSAKLPEHQLYEFCECLELYKNICREWETFHNGYISVVERVRDQYLRPKIRKFLELQAKDRDNAVSDV